MTADGSTVERLKANVLPWGNYLRYKYATADFSAVNTPGLYYIKYGSQKTETFPISTNVYDTIWHATADVWFPVQMDHVAVNEGYRVWHGLAHMDDALQAPLNIQHFDGFRMGASTDTKYKPLERIPGLTVGGWYDAGDYDLQGASSAGTLTTFVDIWETFKPQRDQTLVDQATRFVDIHRPDGKPDILQQVEHGALLVAAEYRNIGHLATSIVDAQLHTYHHLGDAATQTDNLIYDPALKPYQVEGNRSGTPDDRWVFTGRQPSQNYSGIGSLLAASRALRGFNDALADDCLALAKKAYAEEKQRTVPPPPAGAPAGAGRFGAGAEMTALFQLMLTTKEQPYIDRFNELIWPSLGAPGGRSLVMAVRALPLPRSRGRGEAPSLRAEVQGRSGRAAQGQPLRRADRDGRLGGQRWCRGLGDDQLPPAQGVSRRVRQGVGAPRAELHLRHAPGVEHVARRDGRHQVEASGVRFQPGRLHVHPGRHRARA